MGRAYVARRKRELRQLGLVVNRATGGGDDFDRVLDELFPDPLAVVESPEQGEKWWLT